MTNEKAIEIIKSECYVANLLNLDRTSMINSALDIAIKTLEQTRWIPVTERLPEEGEDVLVWYRYWRYGDYNDWYYTYGIGFQYTDIWSVIDGGTRTTVYAWMPLPPKPYKAESEGKE